MQDERFEWNDRKAAENIADYGISFDTARLVFDDPYGLENIDNRFDYDEMRYNILGFAGDRLLRVTFTMLTTATV